MSLGWEGVSGQVVSSVVWNVTFTDFLLSSIIVASWRADDVLFGTLNSIIPNLSEVVYDSRIFRLVESLKMYKWVE